MTKSFFRRINDVVIDISNSVRKLIKCVGLALSCAVSWLLKNTPLINSLCHFQKHIHKQAISKFGVLWALSSLPVIAAVLISSVPPGEESTIAKFIRELKRAFSFSETFVYAAAFLSPILYLAIEKYLAVREGYTIREAFNRMSKLFSGYIIVWIIALLMLLLSIISYTAAKVDFKMYQMSFMSQLGVSFAPIAYLYSLYCWYLSICDGFDMGGNYTDAAKEGEQELSKDFEDRLRSRGGSAQ